jgi:hypothetical protein
MFRDHYEVSSARAPCPRTSYISTIQACVPTLLLGTHSRRTRIKAELKIAAASSEQSDF